MKFSALKEKFLNKQFLTFGIIGVINTAVSILLYMFFVGLHVQVGIASFLGDTLSMVGSYFMNIHFTYKEKPTWKSALAFPLSYLPGIIISAVIVMIVVGVFNGPEKWAKLISIPIYVPINFLCMNVIVKKFGSKEKSK